MAGVMVLAGGVGFVIVRASHHAPAGRSTTDYSSYSSGSFNSSGSSGKNQTDTTDTADTTHSVPDGSDLADDAWSTEDGPGAYSTVEQPAPAGSATGVWWRPGEDEFSPSQLWVFDPSTGTGYQKEYQPTGIDGPFQYQRTFRYRPTGAGVRLSFAGVTGINPHSEELGSLDYDSSAGVLGVKRGGSSESWYGCDSGYLPAIAAILC